MEIKIRKYEKFNNYKIVILMGNSSKPMHKPLNMSQEDEDN